jgi:hypothetical protein
MPACQKWHERQAQIENTHLPDVNSAFQFIASLEIELNNLDN